MDKKFQTEIAPGEPSFEEEAVLPPIEVPNTEEPEPASELGQSEFGVGDALPPGLTVDEQASPSDIFIDEGEEALRQEQGLEALKGLVILEDRSRKLRETGKTLGSILDKAARDPGLKPIVPLDVLEESFPDQNVMQQRLAPTEEQRQKFALESVGMGHWARAWGNHLIMEGKGLKAKGQEAFGESLIQQGQWYVANAPKRDVELFAEIDSVSKGFQWGAESAEEGAASSLPYLAMGAVAKALSLGATLPMVVAGQNSGSGQVVLSLEEMRDEFDRLAFEAEDAGQGKMAQYYKYQAKNMDPGNHQALVQSFGVVVSGLNVATERVAIFNSAPKHLVDEAKKILIRRAVSHMALKGAGGGFMEGVTEVLEDFSTQVAAMNAMGLDAWVSMQASAADMLKLKDHPTKAGVQYRGATESFTAGAAAGTMLGTGGAGVDVARVALAGRRGSATDAGVGVDGLPTEFPAPLPPELMQPQQPAAPAQEPVILDDAQSAKLKEYLANPANLTRPKDYKAIGEALGIPEDKVPAALDSAVEDGTLRKDNRGIYRRNNVEPAKPLIPETGEAAGDQFILPEPASETTQEAQPELAQSEVVPTPAGEVQAGVAEAQAGTDQVSVAIDPATQIREIEGRIESKRQELADVRSGIKGASKEEQAQIKDRSDSLRKEIKALQKELKAVESAPARVAQPQETAAQPTPQQELKAAPQPEFKPEERKQAEAATQKAAAEYLPGITEQEATRLNELAIDQGKSVEDSLENLFKEYAESLVGANPVNNATATPQQSPVPQERAGEGDRPAGQGEADAVREGDAQPGQEGTGGGILARQDVIPFAVYRNERARAAFKFAEKIELRLREALGLTEEAKTKRFISKIKPLTKDGKAIQVKLFDRTLKGLSSTEQAFVREAEGGGSGQPVFAFYNYDTSTIALSLYAGTEAGDTIRSFLAHEVVHALVDIGVITRAEVKLLAKEAEKFSPRALKEIERAYKTLYRRESPARLTELIEEEKAAFLVQVNMDNKLKAEESLIRDILDRIKEFLDGLRAAFRGEGDQEKITWLDVIQTLVDTKVGSGQAGPYVNQDELTRAIEKIRADLAKEKRIPAASVLKAIEKATDELAAQPAPVVGTKRATLSIPGLKRPLSPAEVAEARRKEQSVLGPFPPSPVVADMTGLPPVGFQADIRHILSKRQGKDDERFMKMPQSEQEVRENISRVLEDPHFGYVYKTGNITLIHRTDEFDYVVAVKPKVSGYADAGGQYLEIPTSFVLKKGQIDQRLIASLEDGGPENLYWRKGAAEIDRLLYIVRQARGQGSSPFISQAITQLQKEQLALKGVKPKILAALAPSPNNPNPVRGLNTIIRELADGMGVVLKQGHSKKWGYKSKVGVIRQKQYYDFAALSQNLVPVINQRYGQAYSDLIAKHATELGMMTQTLDPEVGHYEFVQLYLSDPNTAIQKAPNFYEDFEDFLERNRPSDLLAMQTAQYAFQEYQKADPVAAVESMITPADGTTNVDKVKKQIARDGVYETLKNGFLLVYSNVISRSSPNKSLVRGILNADLEATGEKRQLLPSQDPDKLFRMIPYAQQAGTMDIKEGIELPNGQKISKGLPEILRTALGDDRTVAASLKEGSKYSHFLTYLVSLRGRQLWDKYAAGELERSPCVTPRSVMDTAIQQLEAQYPEFVQAQKELNKFTRGMLRLRREIGMLTEKDYQNLLKDKYYVPWQRSFDEEIAVLFDKTSGINSAKFDQRFRGSNRDIIDPFVSLTKAVYATRNAHAQNRWVKSLINLAESTGPVGGKFVERISAQQLKAMNVSIDEAITAVAREQGLSKQDTNDLFVEVAADLGSDAIATLFRSSVIKAGNKPIAFFMEDGKVQAVQINDAGTAQMLFDSINLMNNDASNWLIQAFSLTTQIQRATIVTSIPYIFATSMRDFVAAPSYERRMVPFFSQASGALKIFRGDPLLAEYVRAGGLMGGPVSHGMDQRKLDEGIDKLVALGYGVDKSTSLSDFFRKWSTRLEYTETSTRIKLYEHAKNRALKQGLSEMEARLEAAFYANDYSDYALHGMRTYPIRKMIAFWNASLRGVERFVKTATSQGDYGTNYRMINPYLKYKFGQFEGWSKGTGNVKGQALVGAGKITRNEINQLDQSAAAFFYWVFFVGGISMMLYNMFGDDERLRDVPDDIKATHWIIPTGKMLNLFPKDSLFTDILKSMGLTEDTINRWPKPFESAWLANLIERLLHEQQKEDPNWFTRFKRDFFDATLPPMTPTWLSLYNILGSGIDPMSKKPLLSRREQALDPKDQYKPYTSEFAKWLGEKTNTSPIMIDASLKALGTTWARDILTLNIPGTPWYDDRKPILGTDEYVIMRRFTWAAGKGSEANRNLKEMMGEEDPVGGVFTRLSVPFSRLAMRSKTYAERLKTSTADSVNRYLAEMTPRERGYSILMAGSAGRDSKLEKLDPTNRAYEIGSNAYALQKELTKGTLVLDKGGKKESRVQIDAQTEARAKSTLMLIQAQEAHNALVLTGEPGYAKRVLIDVQPLYEELKLSDPQIYDELKRRNEKANVLPFEGIKAVWPQLQRQLESDEAYRFAQEGRPEQVKSLIRDLWFKAKYPATKMMKLGGPKLPDTTLYEDGSRNPKFEKWPDQDRMELNEDESDAAAMAVDENYGKKMIVKPKPQPREQGI